MSKARLESFSDGVLAVAITLLVLNLKVPGSHVGHDLLRHWPDYAAYTVSFLTIGIIWINHHVMVGRLRQPDHAIVMLNIVLLMTVAVIPFATELMATYLRDPGGEHLAAGVYGGTFLVMSLAFSALNGHILLRKSHLLANAIPLQRRRTTLRRGTAGLIPYVVATALAPVSAYATLAICASVAVFYALPVASSPARDA